MTTAGGTSDPSSMVQVIGGEGASTWVADLRGTFSAGTTIVFEATANSKDWFTVAGVQEGSTAPSLVNNVSGPGPWVYTGTFAGNLGFRVRATSIAGGDAVIATLRLSTGVLAGFSGGSGGGTVQTEYALPSAPRLQSLPVNVSAFGNNTLVPGVGGQTIRIFKVFLVFSTATTAIFQDGASTPFDGALAMTAGGSVVLDLDAEPWFLTSAGNDFVLNLGTSGAVGGRVYFVQS